MAFFCFVYGNQWAQLWQIIVMDEVPNRKIKTPRSSAVRDSLWQFFAVKRSCHKGTPNIRVCRKVVPNGKFVGSNVAFSGIFRPQCCDLRKVVTRCVCVEPNEKLIPPTKLGHTLKLQLRKLSSTYSNVGADADKSPILGVFSKFSKIGVVTTQNRLKINMKKLSK